MIVNHMRAVLATLLALLLQQHRPVLVSSQSPPPPLGYVYWRNATQRAVGTVIPWPKEIHYHHDYNYLSLDPNGFQMIFDDPEVKNCDIVNRAVLRYTELSLLFDDRKPNDRDDPHSADRRELGQLHKLNIRSSYSTTKFQCESMPHDNMDENYKLLVGLRRGDNKTSFGELSASSSWGLIRGLETFSQLIFNISPDKFAIRLLEIVDGPRFKFRGYMLDTARHYISLDKITTILDAMAFNKLNVFHWHMVDDQSFPYVSTTYEQPSKQTAFRPNMVYTQKDVHRVIQYAADRGIRVLPELDTPGHTYAMRSIPNFLTKCYDPNTLQPTGDFGPVNPTIEAPYKSMGKLIDEFNSLFKDSYFHAGGDEVDFDCWKTNVDLRNWMKDHNMSNNYEMLSNYYVERIHRILTERNKTVLVWQEVFDMGAQLPKDNTIIHVWKDRANKNSYADEVRKVVEAGYKALLSSCWYLNYIDYGQDWVKFYHCDPTEGLESSGGDRVEQLVLGGEICMWTEFVDDTNVLTRTWPRASAAAERLWSPKSRVDVGDFLGRLEQIRCRLLSRGVQAEPVNGPGYC